MVLPEDEESKLCKQFNELCKSLNLDRLTCAEGWKSFREFYEPCTLGGSALHWMGCSLYVACKSATTPTVCKNSIAIQGNLINLMGLLRLIDLSIIEFFMKMKKWSNFSRLSGPILKGLSQLERNFNVSMVLYKKYQPIFSDIFIESSENSKVVKKERSRTHNVSTYRIFEFSWSLFVYVKSNYPDISDDLVNSYNLLLACLDYIFVNVFISGRKDVINPDFPLPQSYKSKFISTNTLPCILDVLCSRYDGTYVEAKSIKEYFWRKHIKTLFEKKVLKGNASLLSEVVDHSNIDYNLRNINKKYEEYLLSVGTFDERVFLAQTANFGSPERSPSKSFAQEQPETKWKSSSLVKNNGLASPTNFQSYMKQRFVTDDSNNIASELQHFSTIQTIVSSRESAPGECLKEIIKTCKNKPKIVEFVNDLNKLLAQKLELFYEEKPDLDFGKEYVDKHIEIIVKLFYKLVDSIIAEETKKPSFDPEVLLNQDVILKAIFACSFEITVFSCSTPHQFPWILKALDLPPYYFYKIIEVVVRTEDSLSRDAVQHLRRIEETVLDSMAWTKESPLWRKIIEMGLVPSCEDVTTTVSDVDNSPGNITPEPKVDKLASLAGKESVLTKSPGASLLDKFLTPCKMSPVKRPIAETEDHAEYEPPHKMRNGFLVENRSLKENKKPCMTGPVALFFRKFYYLASIRMCDLCNQLRLTDLELRRKIWTCFETTIVKHVSLMYERHLDQLLMCSIYVICKVSGSELLFKNLMKCYRNQRQAQSHIYRSVLIEPDISLEELKEAFSSGGVIEKKDERGDIIKFYNMVYIKKVKALVKKFTNITQNDRIVLSPIPVAITPPNSSRRISEQHSLYLRTLETDPKTKSSPTLLSQLSYKFSQSPAKDLKAINYMVSKSDLIKVGKRLLADDDEMSENSSSCSLALSNKIQGLCSDRIIVKAEQEG